jgi:hypothetical protein
LVTEEIGSLFTDISFIFSFLYLVKEMTKVMKEKNNLQQFVTFYKGLKERISKVSNTKK